MHLKALFCLASFAIALPFASAQAPDERLEAAVSDAASSSKAGAILDVQGCGISYLGAAGVANRKTRAPMPSGEQLRLASIGKLYTAAIIHQLVGEGLIDLDEPATTYLRSGELDGVPNRDASLRQMLNHTSGIPDYYDIRSYLFTDWKRPITSDFALRIAKRRKATNAPGQTYAYSNTNYQILALVAEQVSGSDLRTLMTTHIFEPLSLEQTRYNTEHPGGTIHGYGTELRSWADTWIYAENTGADGGITATTEDLRTFLQALFLPEGSLGNLGDGLLSSQVPAENDRRIDGAGAEIYIGRDGLQLIGHTGDTMGYLSFAFAIPEYDATIIGHISADKDGSFVKLLRDAIGVIQTECTTPTTE